MKSYVALFRVRFLSLFQYRLAAIAGLSTQLFWGIIYSLILTAFFAEGKAPMTLEAAISFIWINQALFQLIPWNIDKEIEAQIKSGNVAYELVRPVDLYWLWFSRSLALRIVPTFLRAIPLFILAGLFFGLQAPASVTAGIGFASSLIMSTLLSAAMTTLFTLTLFWTLSGEGILRLLPHVSLFLSGLVVPLPLFPNWIQPFLELQPFRAVTDIPCRIYTGLISIDAIILQAAWTVIFIVFGQWLLKRALKSVVIHGG